MIEYVQFDRPIKIHGNAYPSVSVQSEKAPDLRYLESLDVDFEARMVLVKIRNLPETAIPFENVCAIVHSDPEAAYREPEPIPEPSPLEDMTPGREEPDKPPEAELLPFNVDSIKNNPPGTKIAPDEWSNPEEIRAELARIDAECNAAIDDLVDRPPLLGDNSPATAPEAPIPVETVPVGPERIEVDCVFAAQLALHDAKELPRGRGRTNSINRARRGLKKAKADKA